MSLIRMCFINRLAALFLSWAPLRMRIWSVFFNPLFPYSSPLPFLFVTRYFIFFARFPREKLYLEVAKQTLLTQTIRWCIPNDTSKFNEFCFVNKNLRLNKLVHNLVVHNRIDRPVFSMELNIFIVSHESGRIFCRWSPLWYRVLPTIKPNNQITSDFHAKSNVLLVIVYEWSQLKLNSHT